ncbi:MAG: pyridoxamine kinase [Oscillospiraceae bacterium]
MTPKKALCIHDMSSVGRCSLTVISPVLSVMGIQCVPLTTAVLSTHLGGFGQVAMADLTQFCMDSLEQFKRLELKFDCVYSGYLSSYKQLKMVQDAFAMAGSGLKVCDPVMADHGKLYSSLTDELVDGFKDLCRHSDVIIPNPTEAKLLLGEDYSATVFTFEQAQDMTRRLGSIYSSVIITGTKLSDGRVVCMGYDKAKDESFCVPCNYLPVSYPGTGDLFGGTLVSYLLNGESLKSACEKSARFVEKCVEVTYNQGSDTRYGVHLESVLKYLII